MKAATGIGIGLAVAGLLLASMMEGTQPTAFINIPAIIIIFAGTAGATIAAVGMERMKRVPSLYRRVLSVTPLDRMGRIDLLADLADRARREGLLALDGRLGEIEDDYTRKGLQLVVDGTDPEVVAEVLAAEVDGMSARHKANAAVFKQAGGFAPTMGIIGTVMGLVHVLENLAQPATLGPAISGAFIATLIGVASANVVFLPVANRLVDLSHEEVALRVMTMEGLLAIQEGDNPRIVRDKLMGYVPPEQRTGEDAPAAGEASPERAADPLAAEAA
jgi:chemotaxis protein MotA